MYTLFSANLYKVAKLSLYIYELKGQLVFFLQK